MHQGERFSFYSHLLGLALALIAACWMLLEVSRASDAARVLAAAVFALTVIAVYASSSIFHGARGQAKEFWKRLDHCSIYLLIAGTFTPFSLNLPVGFLVAIWVLSIFGISLELSREKCLPPALWPYVVTGWVAVIGALQSLDTLYSNVSGFLFCGALCYSAGLFFYRNKAGHKYSHGIWHLFVLAGTTFHYAAVSRYLIQGN